jgi:hypothetical protein
MIQCALDDEEWSEEVGQFWQAVPMGLWEHFNSTYFCSWWATLWSDKDWACTTYLCEGAANTNNLIEVTFKQLTHWAHQKMSCSPSTMLCLLIVYLC